MMHELLEQAADCAQELEEMAEDEIKSLAFRSAEGKIEGIISFARGSAARRLLSMLCEMDQESNDAVSDALASIERAELGGAR